MNQKHPNRWILGALVGCLLLGAGCQQQPIASQPTGAVPGAAAPAQPQTQPPEPSEAPAATPAPIVLTQQQAVAAEPTDEKDYAGFFEIASAAVLTPGLLQDFVPQGLCAIPDTDYLAVSYYSEHAPTAILALVDLQTTQLSHWVGLRNVDGTPYTGHAGGIASDGKNLWVCSDGNARRMSVQALLDAKAGEEIRFADSFPTGTRASLANYSHGVLWVGDFFTSGGNYNTDQSHHMKTPDGSKHYAWAVGFIGDLDSEDGLKADTQGSMTVVPDYVLSLPSRIQGMTRLDTGEFVLSESYGRKNNSHLLVFQDVLALQPDTTVPIGGSEVPLWYLDGRVAVGSITTPPMSEGIDWADGAVYQLYESGASAYRDTAKNPVDHIYRVELQ